MRPNQEKREDAAMVAPERAIRRTHIARASGVGHIINERAAAVMRRDEVMGSICKAGSRTSVYKLQRLMCSLHYFTRSLISRWLDKGRFILRLQSVSIRRLLRIRSGG